MDTIQILLIIVLSISTIILTVVGIQLVIIMQSLKRILGRTNKILDGFDAIGTGLKHGIGEATGFINGFKTIMKILDLYKKKKKDEK
ncbi:hypothetical protein A3A93_04525 [Candidatus Roizmanbacteria bacterium RIFCSPLOWO2_01_FULL_38_12]|uniref:Uncharacterized protein n=1 Tax=Candidatus Roizmanbacteria bacterium RIFCSPLOWO2_01_FULL_38_12 TaxID=1802061 RepID=A0A1F7IVR0_9BACT|nr:MAG: hypothetical protein A2861_00290 [Candidatus Roizmanbacteria bacterium RIFCSPHIGHO2_01_FULL_38_15]OGK36134.1 MAG: hypothetical protein A3F59_01535 [Candidatus Roizmanbacteria bacterium RIFCSPHIGHO2_12_FULL_38_13]OGK47469.1 MAG: hypothetical protein A3A93_04525 [Candidatus Roizmanbacteria bacterium RIFCSPLOWO2_01_FULL_38_12]